MMIRKLFFGLVGLGLLASTAPAFAQGTYTVQSDSGTAAVLVTATAAPAASTQTAGLIASGVSGAISGGIGGGTTVVAPTGGFGGGAPTGAPFAVGVARSFCQSEGSSAASPRGSRSRGSVFAA